MDAPFVFDDEASVQRNASVRFGDYFHNLTPAIYLSTRSLLFLTFTFNNWIDGQNVFGYHLLNLLLHILNGILIFAIASRIFGKIAQDETTIRTYALLAASFFLLHPVQTESVTYISSRSELLSTFFYLLGFGSFVVTPENKIGLLTGFAALVFMMLGFGGKETVVTLPATILLYDYLFLAKGRWTMILTRWRAYLPFVIVAAVGSYYLLARQVINLVALKATGENLPAGVYFLTQQRVIARYIRLVLLPTGLNLDYDFRPSISILEPAVLVSFLLILGLIFVGWKWRVRKPLFNFSIFWFFITLSPTSSIIPIPDVIFEHRLYLPLAGVCLSFPFVMEWLVRRSSGSSEKRAVLPIAACVLTVLTIGTLLRNEVWRDEVRLFTDVIAKSPNKPRPYNDLIYAYMKRGQEEQAISVAKLGLQNLPGLRVSFLDTIANLYLRLGRPADAVENFKNSNEEAVRLGAAAGFLASSFNNLGVAYLALAKTFESAPGQANGQDNAGHRLSALRDAREAFQNSLEANPDSTGVFDSFINVSRALGEAKVLEKDLRNKLEANPRDFRTLYALAALLSLEERYADSIPYFQRAVELETDRLFANSREVLHFNYAFALAKIGQTDRAMDEYLQTLRIDPFFNEAHYNLAGLYIQKADYDSAVQQLKDILSGEPGNVRANMQLAQIYAYQGKLPLARQHLQQVLRTSPQNDQALSLLQKIGS